eukprot:5593285-Heterocapsa_arctica.AAC.1
MRVQYRKAKRSKSVFSRRLVKVDVTAGGSLHTFESKKMLFGLNFLHGPSNCEKNTDHIGIPAHRATMVERMKCLER